MRFAAIAARIARDTRAQGQPPQQGDAGWAKRETPASFSSWTNLRQRRWLGQRRDARIRLGLCECCGGSKPCAGTVCNWLGCT